MALRVRRPDPIVACVIGPTPARSSSRPAAAASGSALEPRPSGTTRSDTPLPIPADRIIENRVIDSVRRMPQVDRKALQHRHLDQHETETDAGEIPRADANACPGMAGRPPATSGQTIEQDEARRDQEEHDQGRGRIDVAAHDALRGHRRRPRECRRLQHVEEEGTVVGRWAEVEPGSAVAAVRPAAVALRRCDRAARSGRPPTATPGS